MDDTRFRGVLVDLCHYRGEMKICAGGRVCWLQLLLMKNSEIGFLEVVDWPGLAP